MRSGGSLVHHALTTDASNMVKEALTLARCRGHAQVTPLHVASTMLSSPTGILRTACLQSHSHPLQCKALELCFNVALNRLPATSSTASPIPSFYQPDQHNNPHSHPSISNALVAAFKRAQAHQRRGTLENQQQQLLAVKIEIEQLIISILDDPSVSRVMREAGFSSTQVKANVEKTVSVSELSSPKTLPVKPREMKISSGSDQLKKNNDEDVMSVIDVMMNKKKKGVLIVGELASSLQGIVGGLMEKVDRGQVPEGFKQVQFISFPLFILGSTSNSREEAEKRLDELRVHVNSCVERGVILYLGDLNWVSNEYKKYSSFRGGGGGGGLKVFCPLEHMVIELGRLVSAVREYGKIWLMGIANFQTYLRCRNGNPSLEAIWDLHPLTLPESTLSLSHIPTSNSDRRSESTTQKEENENGSTFCSEATTSSILPSWLRQYKEQNNAVSQNVQDSVNVMDIRDCMLAQTKDYTSTSGFSYDHQNPNILSISARINQIQEPSLTMYNINPSSYPNSGSSSDVMDDQEAELVPRFGELNSENVKILCDSLVNIIPTQNHIIPEMVRTILQCRSGIGMRRGELSCWLLFEGMDIDGKEKIAKELANLVFGSYLKLVKISLSTFSPSTRGESSEDPRNNKRSRDEESHGYFDRLAEAICEDPHRVLFVEDVEQADYCSRRCMKRAMERGRLSNSNGKEVSLCDAIIILSCERLIPASTATSAVINQKPDNQLISSCISFDLNISLNDGDVDFDGSRNSTDHIGLLQSIDESSIKTGS